MNAMKTSKIPNMIQVARRLRILNISAEIRLSIAHLRLPVAGHLQEE